jgi:hypothetical protein
MTFYQPLAFPAENNERRHDRHSVDLPSRVRELGSPGAMARIADVSLGGCRLRQADLPKNAEIWVTIGGSEPMRARVVWVKAGEAGCQFYNPITRMTLRNVMCGRIG